MDYKHKSLLVVPFVICSLICIFSFLGFLLELSLGIPNRLEIPIAIRAFGAVVLGFGFAFLIWILRFRKPIDILVSTYVTMRKNILRKPLEEKTERTEPLVLQGPQRHVRHPLYFAVVVLILGWWLALDYTFILFVALFFFLWFNLVVIRFEERELKAIYPEEYNAYIRAVPKFIPSFKSRWPLRENRQ